MSADDREARDVFDDLLLLAGGERGRPNRPLVLRIAVFVVLLVILYGLIAGVTPWR